MAKNPSGNGSPFSVSQDDTQIQDSTNGLHCHKASEQGGRGPAGT